jgi:hypothetical protein
LEGSVWAANLAQWKAWSVAAGECGWANPKLDH